MTLYDVYDIVHKQSQWKLDRISNLSEDLAEQIWPRANPYIGDKLMYKNPESNDKLTPVRLKEVCIEGKWDYLDKEFAEMHQAIANAADREMKRRMNECINEEYCMNYNENVRMRIDYEKMAAPYNKTSEAKKKNPVFLRIDIKNVIFNPPATIVFWTDNTKTVVKAQDGEPYDPEKGLTMAICKKVYGNEGNYFNKIKKWTEPAYKELEEREKAVASIRSYFESIINFGFARKVPKETKEPPIVPLNKKICKLCVKGAPYGDCSHLETNCKCYDMFVPINSTTWPDEDDRLPVRDDS